MKVTFLGHSCFQIELNNKTLLIDPFISGNPLQKGFDISELNPDYILVTHAHQDHILDVEQIAKQSGATLISNYEIVSYYQAKGINGHPLNHGGKASFDFGTVKYTQAIHSSVFPDGSNGGNPGGFVIWNDSKCIYIAGDTALSMDMKLIQITCPKVNCAILPIGDNFTMGYEDAFIASDYVKCNTVIACHFDTFPYIEIDKDAAKETFKSKNLILPEFGQSIEI